MAFASRLFLAGGVAALAAGCAQPSMEAAAPEVGWITLTTAEEFDEKLVGRTLTYDNGLQIVSNADGSYSGNRDISGRWEWVDGALCREIRISDRMLPYECQQVQISADGTRFRALNPDGSPRAVASIG